ncbi:MAG: hypothetical protein HY769_09260 [Candidatus Stahlbacteria bacterium]|nr:hypothetical protein [Candidatus Stahlbacteria bacterium]
MKSKGWIIKVAVFVAFLIAIMIAAPKILTRAFEESTKRIETSMINKSPPEYSTRIQNDFALLIAAFKKNKIKQDDLAKLSDIIKSANQDGKLDTLEIKGILELIETITPGLK